MKKISILFGSLLLSLAVFSQAQKVALQTSAVASEAKKVSFEALTRSVDKSGAQVFSMDGQPFTGTTYDEYDVSEICREVVISKGQIQKQTGWYYDGKKEREYFYKNGFPEGKCLVYHRSGNVFSVEQYRDGQLDGKQYRYNCDGTLRAEWDSVSGLQLFRIDFEVKECIGNCRLDEGC